MRRSPCLPGERQIFAEGKPEILDAHLTVDGTNGVGATFSALSIIS
jgi:hypothetical protein